MIGCLPTQALAFSPVSIQTQSTQRKRLRLDGNRALHSLKLLYCRCDVVVVRTGLGGGLEVVTLLWAGPPYEGTMELYVGLDTAVRLPTQHYRTL